MTLSLQHPRGQRLVLNSQTGLPEAIVRADGEQVLAMTAGITVEIGGTEQRGATGGLDYVDTSLVTTPSVCGPLERRDCDGTIEWRVPADLSGMSVELVYTAAFAGPAFGMAIEFIGPHATIIRNVECELGLQLEARQWVVTAPGNGLTREVPLERVQGSFGVSPLGGLRGSAGLTVLHQHGANATLALWCDNTTEIPEILLKRTPAGVSYVVKTNFGADLADADRILLDLLALDADVPAWPQFPTLFREWMLQRGLTSPGQPPNWIRGSMIYEAQVGFSVFHPDHRYSPYPEVTDLTADLDRIQQLGFTTIQLMPRQPYPSYNVHDYWDISTSYGQKDQLIELVREVHRRGMRIILDVLLHGVLDQESIRAAADGVRRGPYRDRIGAETGDSFSSDVSDWDNYLIAWSRHIMDFEQYWTAGSPPVSPLIAEHPDWFFRDSAGNVTGVYTKAFDASHPGWQDYFIAAMRFLMMELDLDGFRFDAPTYNDFYNWSPSTRRRAGASALGCVSLFERLRPELKAIKADMLMYTEPSGHLLRQSMDLNYNYDEQWLVTALAKPDTAAPWGVRGGRDLARWLSDRDAVLPTGALTAHHIDSHDTFWWPSWGTKWRREQFDLTTVRLLTVAFGLLPGPYMMFSGGEVGIEDLLPRIADLKQDPTWRDGSLHWHTEDEFPAALFGMTRALAGEHMTLVVNLADRPEQAPFVISTAQTETLVGEAPQARADHCVIAPRSAVLIRQRGD